MYQLPGLKSEKGLMHGFSSVSEGNMSFLWGDEGDALRNRKGFLERSDIDPKNCAVMSVLSDNQITMIETGTKIGIGKDDRVQADALVVARKGVFLFLLIADCLPVILYEPKSGVLALAHCGWRSTNTRLLMKLVDFLKGKFNVNPKDFIVGIGPGIHKESYKYGNPPQKQLPGWEDFLTDLPGGQTAIDIVGYNRRQLVEAGIKEENIEISDIDTAADSTFFSHYRSKKNGETEGRFAAVVGMV